MKEEGGSRGGGTVSTVEVADSTCFRDSVCTVARCDRQFAGVRADVLYPRTSVPAVKKEGNTHAAKTPVSSCTSNDDKP